MLTDDRRARDCRGRAVRGREVEVCTRSRSQRKRVSASHRQLRRQRCAAVQADGGGMPGSTATSLHLSSTRRL
ncbi:MAG: hypothetical protein ACPIOQ_12995, partial [Promethearchaeia archaeon]